MLIRFIRKLWKTNKENKAVDKPQAAAEIVRQAEIPAAGVSQPKNVPAAFDPEKVIAGVARAMMDAMKVELDETRVLAEAFIAAGKHLESNSLPVFRGRQWEKCVERCRNAAEAYIVEQDGIVQECWQDVLAKASATDSAEWTCILLRNALQQQLGTELRRSAYLTQLFAQMRELDHAWRQCFIVPVESDKEKGIRILYGEYGECDFCIGYDYAHQVFVSFNPDDNYYHWSDYHINPIARETAVYFLKRSLSEYPECSNPEAAERYYANASTRDIRARVIK